MFHELLVMYLLKTSKNYESKSTKSAEGQLDAVGLKRVDYFVNLIGNNINKLQTIF